MLRNLVCVQKRYPGITEHKIHWVAFKQQFFSSVIIADKLPFEGAYMVSERQPDTSPYISRFAKNTIPYDRSADFTMPMHFILAQSFPDYEKGRVQTG